MTYYNYAMNLAELEVLKHNLESDLKGTQDEEQAELIQERLDEVNERIENLEADENLYEDWD